MYQMILFYYYYLLTCMWLWPEVSSRIYCWYDQKLQTLWPTGLGIGRHHAVLCRDKNLPPRLPLRHLRPFSSSNCIWALILTISSPPPPPITASLFILTNQTCCWLAARTQWVSPHQQWSNAVGGPLLMKRDGTGQILLPDATQRANNCTKGR